MAQFTGFKPEFFKANRKKLAKALPDSYILLAAHANLQESADLSYPFRQDSSFWYFCGLDLPNAVLAINSKNQSTTLFLPKKSDYQQEWEGQEDHETIKRASLVDQILNLDFLQDELKQAKKNGLKLSRPEPLAEVVEPYGFFSNPARKILDEKIKKVEPNPKDIRLQIAKLRQVKQLVELEAIRNAIKITADTLYQVKQRLSDFKNEADIERAVTTGFFANGAEGHAYEPIVASGYNASIIHYTKNNDKIAKNSLLLLDVGAKANRYCSDISRTWQVGQATDRQKQVYDAVIRLQDKALSMLGPGVLLRDYQKKMEKEAFKELKKLGQKLDRYPHGFSHFMGLDVHDAGDYESPLVAGSVITVEPGIYLSEENIGIRIEDNILITDSGYTNLSSNIPRDL